MEIRHKGEELKGGCNELRPSSPLREVHWVVIHKLLLLRIYFKYFKESHENNCNNKVTYNDNDVECHQRLERRCGWWDGMLFQYRDVVASRPEVYILMLMPLPKYLEIHRKWPKFLSSAFIKFVLVLFLSPGDFIQEIFGIRRGRRRNSNASSSEL